MCMCIFPGKAIPEMTYTVSSGTLNPTRSLTVLNRTEYGNKNAESKCLNIADQKSRNS